MDISELEKMMKKNVKETDNEIKQTDNEIKQTVQMIYETEICDYNFKVFGTKEEPFFLAQQIANILGYAKNEKGSQKVSKMLEILDEDEKCMFLYGEHIIRQMWFVTEDGLYRILMRSNQENARHFQKQVSKILKEIRLTGGYVVEHREEEFIENHYDFLSSETKNAMLSEMREHIKKQNAIIEEQNKKILLDAPKIESYEQFMDCNGLYTTTNVAKLLDIKRGDLFKWLRDGGYVYKQKTVCTEKARQKGYLVMKIVNNYDCMYFTPKGVQWIKESYEI